MRFFTLTLSVTLSQNSYTHTLMYTSHRKLLSAVSQVTIEDLTRVGTLYFSKLLDPQLTNTAVSCNPSKVQEVKTGLERYVVITCIFGSMHDMHIVHVTHTHTHIDLDTK